jgi:Methyltransferase domain
MLQENSQRVLNSLAATDVVLDIGGWAHPFNRADYVMDCQPYDTRGYYNRTFAKNNPIPAIGGDVEFFTEQTWIVRDICDKKPYPFRDKEIDFVVCSHTLEDIRDPLWVCSEMIRISKAGYIEVPSRIWETCRGTEQGIAGLSHHRWLIDIDQSRAFIRFLPKFHFIHNWRYSLPKSVLRRLDPLASVQWLYWQDSFQYTEAVINGVENVLDELETFVSSVRPYSRAALLADDALKQFQSYSRRAAYRCRRLLGST